MKNCNKQSFMEYFIHSSSYIHLIIAILYFKIFTSFYIYVYVYEHRPTPGHWSTVNSGEPFESSASQGANQTLRWRNVSNVSDWNNFCALRRSFGRNMLKQRSSLVDECSWKTHRLSENGWRRLSWLQQIKILGPGLACLRKQLLRSPLVETELKTTQGPVVHRTAKTTSIWQMRSGLNKPLVLVSILGPLPLKVRCRSEFLS